MLSLCYGIELDKTFEDLLLGDEIRSGDFVLPESYSRRLPVLPDDYFEGIEQQLRPGKDATTQQRYDTAVKLLIRDCAKQNVLTREKLTRVQRTGAFHLFLQTEEMADFYRRFRHK